MKKNINNVDYKETLADTSELKGFSEEAENLLLSMLYKIDEGYDNYRIVKREVPTKEEFIQSIILIVRSRIKEITIVKPHTQAMTFYKNNIFNMPKNNRIVDAGASGGSRANTLNSNNMKLISLPNENSMLYEIAKIGARDVDIKLRLEDKAIFSVLDIGRCISDTESIRDFNGWAWSIAENEIQSNVCNIIYTFLTFLLGQRFVNSITNVNQIEKNVSKAFYTQLKKACIEFYNSTNKNVTENYLRKIASLRDELSNMKHQAQNQDEIIAKKKEAYDEIKKIDRALSDPKELKLDFIATNKTLPKDQQIYSISNYSDMIEDRRKSLVVEINRLNKLQNPTEFMKMKDDLLMKIKFYEEKTFISSLSKEFLNELEAKIDSTRDKKEILSLIYKLRYLNFIPNCRLKVKPLEQKLITKAIKYGIINPISNIGELDYRILKGIFRTQVPRLEGLSIELTKSHDGLNVELFDGEVHDKSYFAPTPKDSEIEIRKVKKYKIFA